LMIDNPLSAEKAKVYGPRIIHINKKRASFLA
jgi:hypothetical protein